MKQTNRFRNKKVLVLGLAMSGFHAAKLLLELGAFVTVNDAKQLDENPDAQELVASGIKVVAGQHPLELLDESFAYIVKNPGIPYSNPMVVRAQEIGIPILSEVEVAYEVLEAPLVGVTGTNGKTTTTSMIAAILGEARRSGRAFTAGNIGVPASQVAQEATPEDDVVMELSSFQLMGIDQLRPQIAVITNITEAHLDYHGSRKEYVAAKWRITENQTETDYLVLNGDQEELLELAESTRAAVVPFSRIKELRNGAYVKGDWIYFRDEKVMPVAALHVPGAHNVENALAAVACAKLKGIENSVIERALSAFAGVEHRIQYVGTVAGRRVYNDSKSTNILAARTALDSFPDDRIVLLAGGLDRGNTFEELVPSLQNVKAMVVFGETASKLQEAAAQAGIPAVVTTKNVETAVPEAFRLSEEGDVILLSPACASWDQYRNFEERGQRFVTALEHIKQEGIEVEGRN